jgi:peptidoglycan pentaglycine glycine transferase (the second and third glycine)
MKDSDKMVFTKLTEKEFDQFSFSHEQGSFYQSSSWAKIKKSTNWIPFYYGIKENNEIIAGSLILKKQLFTGFSFFYAPRGFFIDYKNKVVLNYFVDELKKVAKKEKAIFIKIDPYVKYVDRDTLGNIKENSNKQDKIINNLKDEGFKHLGFSLFMEGLQPRWAMVLDLKNKTSEDIYKNMERNTRNIVNTNEKNGITTKEISIEDLEIFKHIMDHTADRRHFIDRPLEYYKTILESFKENATILIAEFDFKEFKEKLQLELENNKQMLVQKEKDLIEKEGKINVVKTNERIEFFKKEIDRLNKKISHIDSLILTEGEKVIMGGTLFISHGSEVLALFGGAYSKYKEFFPSYTVYWNMIQKLIEQKYNKYNFYGITGNFEDKKHELYGLYEFKKGFGCEVEEYIGEFDLIISKSKFFLYNFMLKGYNYLKKVKQKWNL